MKIAKTAPDALKILWKEQTLLKTKKVAEIKDNLEKRGYNFTDKNLLMALKLSKFLTRRGSSGSFTYVQKHPFIEDDIIDK